MYQHDVPVKRLQASLQDIVVECVSFVGVDLNTCPLHVLRSSRLSFFFTVSLLSC